ncbi:GNAT family N-acetyltransferase [Longispora sp. NPDC051575]|uniref:GNAT family N-acetyltransferase n=1 Tax=Longispora sp. NPDC051575 TaxID=3154943 RepID=UPI00343B0611
MAVVVEEWVGVPDERLRAEIHRVIAAVVDVGGAVGFLATPDRAEVDAWIDSLLGGIAGGRAGMVLCRVDGRVEALGSWARGAPGPQGHTALLSRIMAHPSARGLGLGRRVVTSLVDAVAAVGVEVALLSVRGNNHGAVALYEDCGFTVYGVVPNGLAVGDVRFDEVRMVRQVALPETVTIHGRAVGGPGGSVRRANA